MVVDGVSGEQGRLRRVQVVRGAVFRGRAVHYARLKRTVCQQNTRRASRTAVSFFHQPRPPHLGAVVEVDGQHHRLPHAQQDGGQGGGDEVAQEGGKPRVCGQGGGADKRVGAAATAATAMRTACCPTAGPCGLEATTACAAKQPQARYGLEKQFSSFLMSYKTGNFKEFERNVFLNAEWLKNRGLFMIMKERTKLVMFRNLYRIW